ncbi:ATP-binding protein [Thermophagus sp. OGC60D27]|uniref:ATP-binding protein n=1 Tax=Thermophagus sp. OGC60D27 TaxID=3458415 RepID=UPI0040376DA7
MKDLAMHIMDIVDNSVNAGATHVEVQLNYRGNILEMTIRDNGCGIDPAMIERVTDPYTTSRTSRNVGLGLSFLKMNAERTGGKVTVLSEPQKGTTIAATFITSHIDCIPEGDLAKTLALIISGNPLIDFKIRIIKENQFFEISSGEIKEILDGIPVSHPKVNVLIRNMLNEIV